MRFQRLAFCAMSCLVVAQAQADCRGDPPPVQDSSFGFCVNKAASTSQDRILDLPEASCKPTTQAPGRTWMKIKMKSDGKSFTPASPHAVDMAVIVIHGAGGAPGPLFTSVQDGMGFEPEFDPAKVWLVGPQFLELGELPLEADVVNWECSEDDAPVGRSIGDATVHPADVEVSSYDLIDHMIKRIKAASTSALKEIVVIGHSGGGRFVGRYSMSTDIETTLGSTIAVRYIISASSSYVYMTPKRYVADPGCTDYDEYPFGLLALPGNEPDVDHYVTGGRKKYQDRFRNKSRLFIVGEEDVAVGDPHCQALRQGGSRIERARLYWRHLKEAGYATNAHFCTVPGAGHATPPVIESPGAVKYWKFGNVTGVANCE